MRSTRRLFYGSIAVAALLAGLLYVVPRDPSDSLGSEPLLVFCAAGVKPPMDGVAQEYEANGGPPVQVQYGGSGTLLSNLRVARRGDLYLAADRSYMDLARSQGLVQEIIPLARLKTVIAVRKGNPKGVSGIPDLARTDLKVALANPEAAAVGRITRELLEEAGRWPEVFARVEVLKLTVMEVANAVKLGSVDAGVVWDATVAQYPELEAVETPELSAGEQEVAIGVLSSSTQPTAALRFARYLGAKDRGLGRFAMAGYEVVEGDAWAESPEVVLFSGGVNRMAIEPTIRRFEEREGVRVTRVYNGCGILVSQIKLGQQPDAYLACDVSFMDPVSDLFASPFDVSETDIVMLVAKGNPQAIRTLADLGREGMRVGVTNAKQSTLGDLTARLLRSEGIFEEVMANVRSQTPTADLLVNQIRTGSLDAVVVYAANTSQVRDSLTVVPLDLPAATATQPYAVGRNSEHRHLMDRLLAAIRSSESRRQYEAVGFRWKQPASLP